VMRVALQFAIVALYPSGEIAADSHGAAPASAQQYLGRMLAILIILDAEHPGTSQVGATSLVIWSITALVLIKYCLVVLRADDHGQGANLFSRQHYRTAPSASRRASYVRAKCGRSDIAAQSHP